MANCEGSVSQISGVATGSAGKIGKVAARAFAHFITTGMNECAGRACSSGACTFGATSVTDVSVMDNGGGKVTVTVTGDGRCFCA